MCISCAVSKIRRYSPKIANSLNPHLFNAPGEEAPRNCVKALGLKKLEWWGYLARKWVWLSVAVWKQTTYECVRQTDTCRQLVPHFRLYSNCDSSTIRAQHATTRYEDFRALAHESDTSILRESRGGVSYSWLTADHCLPYHKFLLIFCSL